nr:related to amidase [Melanopsichium pennsylvanicum 4]
MIAKTTAPQLMMSNTTESPLWGTTRGAVRSAQQDGQDFQVGGSSGGEAALVKLGGSQLGVGTDMGGSVRQPACLNELYGYKFTSTPDSFRWQLPHDFMTGLPHTKVPATAPGLLARDILTLKTAADTLYKHYYSNVRELNEEEHRRDHRDARWETPESEDLGNNPRIVYTTQQSSPEVQKLIRWLITTLEGGDKLLRPRRCKELGDVDVKAWGEAWLDHAKEHGFDDARAMLADDPLIKRTMFDECRLSTWKGVDKKSWKADSSKLKDLKKSFVSQAGLFSENSSSSEDEEENEEDDKDQHADSMRNGSKNNVIIITPTYVLGGPVQNSSFISLDDVGESEIWCQIFNLLDFPALSIPLGKLPCGMREKLREEAVGSPEWCRYLAGKISADLLDKSDQDRLPVLSVQFATVPDNHVAMLDYANRISKMFAYTL